jgi:sodium/potassium-transporting ATPase subunit alpha
MDEHKIPMEELVHRFGTSLEAGMKTEAAMRRNAEEGDNKLPEKKKTPAWIRFLKEVTNWFAIMLWIGSILCIVTYIVQPFGNLPNLYLAFVLIIVILITGVITFSQQAQSEALMEGFKNMLPSVTKCLRDGKLTQLPAEKLVRGDIVEVISGEKVPADLRIISSIEMKVDNSPLTGEVEPLLRSPECTHPEEPFETKNIAFFGTLCKEGRGRGIVINIGANTVMGQIADLAATGGNQRSPLRIELDRFVLIITVIAISLGVVFFILALLVVKYSALQCIIFGIGILVANVPEGLLACITISLAITAKKLSEKQVLVKNLEAVETLGSTSCICSDKTGTLTQNKMTVENIWIDSQVLRAHSKEIKGPDFEYEYEVDDPSFKVLHHTAMICSEAKFDVSEEMMRDPAFRYANASVIGDASETALVKFYQPIEDIGKTRALYSLGKCKDGSESKMPFNSTNKYALSIVKQPTPDAHYYAYIKGAPEKIWKYCGRVLYQGKFKQIDAEDRKNFDSVNLRFGKNGERVLGFAMLPLNKETYYEDYPFNTSSPDNFNFPMENYIFVGLISLMDPPKESVPFAIKKCQSAGIKVIMVTGDQPPTAAAIAKQIGIITMKTNEDLKEEGYDSNEALQKANAIVIHGDMIVKAFEDGDDQGTKTLEAWVRKPQIVFARTTPAQKLQIVKACQAIGNVVGVTGDGVNDSPAIKQGDIGISMGISGSDVTKDAADMILLNDDFSSIVDGVEEGRKIFDNLKKTIVYLLTSNMTEIWPFVALVIVQIPLPLSNIFMLIICVGTDIYPALALAYEEAEVDIMTRKPRKITDHLVTGRLLTHAYGQMGEIATAGGFFTYFLVMQLYGFTPNNVIELLSVPCVNPIDSNGNVNTNYDTPYTFQMANSSFPFGNPAIPLNPNNAVYNTNFPNWLSPINNKVDLRGFYLYNCGTSAPNNQFGYCQKFIWPTQVLTDSSSITGQPIAYTTETIFYAQSAYFVTIVMVQWSNVFACKSRKVLPPPFRSPSPSRDSTST